MKACVNARVDIRRDERIETALRRLKRFLDQNGIRRDIARSKYYEKPSTIRHRRAKKRKASE